MKIIDVIQGTPEWHAARLGIPTASKFDKILTNKTLKLSASAILYAYDLTAEWIIGESSDSGRSSIMERGLELEEAAMKWYEFETDQDTREVGFITDDDGRYGCSPDRLVGDDGGLEIKCPMADTHIKYLLSPTALVDEYRHQVQGGLWITGRKWWDLVSYHPVMPKVRIRLTPDADWIEAFEPAFTEFLKALDEVKAQAKAKGCIPWLESDAYKMLQEAKRREAEQQDAAPSEEIYA